MPDQDGSRKLFGIKSRRLQKLKEQQAFKGENVVPSISMEIEDLEDEIEKLSRGINPISQNRSSPVISESPKDPSDLPVQHLTSATSAHGEAVEGSIVNPWRSGSFYLFTFFLGFLAYFLLQSINGGRYNIIVAIGVAMLVMIVVGAFQLRNDDRLSEASFTTLVSELFKRFPFFGKSNNDEY